MAAGSVAGGLAAPSEALACTAAYQAQSQLWRQLSGAEVEYMHQEMLSANSWAARKKLDSTGLRGEFAWADSFVMLEQLYEATSTQVLACWVHGGRYWNVQLSSVSSEQLHQWLVILLGIVEDAAAESMWRIFQRFGGPSPGLLTTLRCGACAPQVCSRRQARAQVLTQFFAQLLLEAGGLRQRPSGQGPVLEGPPPTPPWTRLLRASEVSHWSHLSLDFVLAGINACGTTSIHRNLAQHPDIRFTGDDEDSFFTKHFILPLESTVREFNQKHAKSGPSPKILGLYDANIFEGPFAGHQLARIPGLKMIVVVCDPVSRLEKLFFEKLYCKSRADVDDRELVVVNTTTKPEARPCSRSISVVLDMPEFLEKISFGHHLYRLVQMFQERLIVMHQSFLRESPAPAYDLLSTALGVGPFPRGMRFHRYNSLKGHRTDLCRRPRGGSGGSGGNRSLIRTLQKRLMGDYEVVEALVAAAAMPVPEDVQLRLTRCDRPAELGELDTGCSAKGQCGGDSSSSNQGGA
mmetsp:Transcript_75003/g.242602  ORF Transcript_75003/g.242602 Transcript_75003/m.242602 type:complete len:520 (+) Transcript_75003:142-1701(+)